MRTAAIITARGGSKRIPRKNIKEFCGQPILAYSIQAAISSGIFDTVMVSTDDEEIAEVAVKYGAEVPFFRSEKTSNDFATTTDVILEVLEEYRKRGQEFDLACCIYPTAPSLTGARLLEAREKLVHSDADTLIPVVQFSFPVQRAFVMEEERLVFEYPQYMSSRSQDLTPHYHDVGQFYFFRTASFEKNRNLLVGNILPLVLSEMEVQDIDTLQDWEVAEFKYRMIHGK